MHEQACVYIMASARNGILYVGSTIDLSRRIWEHRNGVVDGFTREHGCKLRVWYEVAGSWEAARTRERREIEGLNPDWEDLYERVALP